MCMPINLQSSEEVIRVPEAGVVGGCELLCGCWKQNPGPLQDQEVHLTTEPLSSSWGGFLTYTTQFISF